LIGSLVAAFRNELHGRVAEGLRISVLYPVLNHFPKPLYFSI
jgi:hypothetical protein